MNSYIEYTWLQLTLTEGKFRQVRKMLAAVKHHCVRLIRVAIEDIELGNLPPGEVAEINEADFFRLLRLEKEAG
jgi:23S rRNA pseudouridine2457 synthase